MSTTATTELSITPEIMDNSKITLNNTNNKLILENNSSDITISKFEGPNHFSNVPQVTNSPLAMKTQVLPVVYFPNASKMPFATLNKTNANVIVNNIPSIQFATINNTTTAAPSVNQNLILTAARPQSLLIQKQPSTKITGAYLTMLKPIPSSNDTNASKFQVAGGPMQDISMLNNNIVQQQNPQKIMITPMPKVTSNRLPATVTTNSLQPKIALLPMPVPSTESIGNTQVFNFNMTKMTDLKVQNNDFSISKNRSPDNSIDMDSNSENLACDEVINLDSPEKSDINNKTYELSITEDSVSSQGETRSSLIISKACVKENQKFPKHGVSILKKNYMSERKVERLNSLMISNNNSLNSVLGNQELSVSKTDVDNDNIVITIPQKIDKERRRKSNFSYRTGFDDDLEIVAQNQDQDSLEIIPSDRGDLVIHEIDSPEDSLHNEDPTKKLPSEIEIELIKESPVDTPQSSQEELDIQKVLKWDDGIGTLPGSNLKFIINEYNMLEYITDDEYKDIVQKRMVKAKEKMKDVLQEEMRCLECGCYGLPSEFINPKYCSMDCQESHQIKCKKEAIKAEKFRNRKRKQQQQKTKADENFFKTDIKFEPKEEEISEEDSNDNLSSVPDKYQICPWTCKKKGFSWSKYLDHIKAKPAPVKLFKDPFPYNRNGFRPGMKMEGVDPQHPSYFCVLSVSEVVGYRMRLHFDGYPDGYDYWCNADSNDIFPMGWCEKHSHVLQPPPGYTVDNFNWVQYLKQTKSIAAPKNLFVNRAGQAICPNGFRIGMKLEAVDRKNTSLVCVATVRDMMDNRILVHFDSWDDIYDYWADPTSPYIHPVGWCDQYGHNLTPPNDYPNPETFSWEVYLKYTKSVAAPVRAFKQRPACGFKRGMRLECVDKRVPQLIRVARVDDVKEHQIRIHFDGWRDRYSYWVDDDSPDIHPMGWCQKTGHPIEPPLTPDDVYDLVDCRTVGCKGLGHIKGPQFSAHTSPKDCPYAEGNIDLEKVLPDRLLSPDRYPEEAEPVSREPKECKIKPRLGRPPKQLRLEHTKPEPPSEEPPEKKPKKIHRKPTKTTSEINQEKKATALIEEGKHFPGEKESWLRHSRFLKKYITNDDDPRSWTSRDVINFVSTIPCCEGNVEVFKKEKIDGEALLSLSQKDIVAILRLKVGPAVKLYNSIVLLRQQIDEKVSI